MDKTYKIDIAAYFKIIWRFRYLIAILFVFGGLLGYFVSRFITPKYETSVEFVFPEESMGSQGFFSTDILKAVGADNDTTGTEIEIITSESVFGNVIKELQLNIDRRDIPRDENDHEIIGRIEVNDTTRYGEFRIKFVDKDGNYIVENKGGGYLGSGSNGYWFNGAGIAFLLAAKKPPKKGTSFILEVEDPKSALNVMSEKNISFFIAAPRIILLKTNHHNPVTTKRMAEEIVNTYILEAQSYNMSVSKEAGLLLKRRINEMERRLKQDQKKMADYQIDNHILYSGGGTEAMVADIGLIKSTMVEAELKRDQLRLLLSKLENEEDFDSTVVDAYLISGIISGDSGLANLHQRINGEKALLDTLRAKYTDDHPSVIASKESIAEMERSLMIQTYEALNKALENYSDNAASAEAKFNAYTEELPLKEMDLAILEKDVITDIEILKALYTEYEALKVSEIKEEGKKRRVRIIKEPHIPSEPVFPDKKKNAIVTAVILSFFGIVWAFVNHFFDFSPLYERIPFYNSFSKFKSKIKSIFARN